jgi:hypothetical protein
MEVVSTLTEHHPLVLTKTSPPYSPVPQLAGEGVERCVHGTVAAPPSRDHLHADLYAFATR